jgi:pimeloyl-ACP methyl ester carboxylesterase
MSLADDKLARDLEAVFDQVNVADPLPDEKPEPIARRRSRRGPRPSSTATLSLVRVDGVLRWTYRRPARRVGRRRAVQAGAGPIGGKVITSFDFREIPPNEIVKKIEDLDAKLTPNRGLRQWKSGTLIPVAGPVRAKRILLFIHGTFSKSEMFFAELTATPEGRAMLAAAAKKYAAILAFDHPTLSVSPILNAMDLEESLAGTTAPIDVVCHSRGGLVAAWWLRIGRRKVDNVMFVASPLEGTSLASPPRLKNTLDRLANIADAIEKAASVGATFSPPAAPLLGIASGLMQVLGGALSIGARTPLVDAGVAVVAGLAGQSAVGNNPELLRLHRGQWQSSPRCFAVKSDFEPGDPTASWWAFWKSWKNPALKAADIFADPVFSGPNDLVVDAGSMTRRLSAELPAADVFDFQTNNVVHHCNYFAQKQTVDFLRQALSIP